MEVVANIWMTLWLTLCDLVDDLWLTFVVLQKAQYVIIIEEDLDVSPDFFRYVIVYSTQCGISCDLKYHQV